MLKSKYEIGGTIDNYPIAYFDLKLGESPVFLERNSGAQTEFPLGWMEAGNRDRDNQKFERFTPDSILNEWCEHPGTYLVLGEPGAGKSTLLRHWADKSLLNQHISHTVFITLREVPEAMTPKAYLTQKLSEDKLKYDETVNDYSLIFFDGWDEFSQKKSWAKSLHEIPGVKIVTCRTLQYIWELKHSNYYFLMSVLPTEQKQFLANLAESWKNSLHQKSVYEDFKTTDDTWASKLSSLIQSNNSLRMIASNPLLLTLIARLYSPNTFNQNPALKLAETRAEFYQLTFNQLCEDHFPNISGKHNIESTRKFLQCIVSITGRQIELNEATLNQAYEKLKYRKDTKELKFEQLKKMALSSQILKPVINDKYKFLHLTFQEWLLAYEFAETGLQPYLEKYWRDPFYEQVLSFSWGMTQFVNDSDRLKFTQYLIDQGCQDSLENNKNQKCSGLRTALHLWQQSGLCLDPQSKHLLKTQLQSDLRKLYIAYDSEIPTDFLAWLADSPNDNVRRVIAGNTSTPVKILIKLAQDNDFWVRLGIAKHANCPESILNELMHDKNQEFIEEIAHNINTPANTLSQLIKDESNYYRIRHVLKAIAKHVNASPQTLIQLAKSNNIDVEEAVAKNPISPPEALTYIAKNINEGDVFSSALEAVARNKKTSPDALTLLARHESENLRTNVAENCNTPVETLTELARDNEIQVRETVAKNINTPVEILRQLAQDEEMVVQRAVARNITSPIDLKHKLTQGNNKLARWIIAINTDAPAETLKKLADDNYSEVRRAVAENKNTLQETLFKLAQDHEIQVRGTIARNTNTPSDALYLLAQDNEPRVRDIVARNANTPSEALHLLAQENDKWIRKTVASNPNTSAEALRLLAQDTDYEIRYWVARHHNCPTDTLIQLAETDAEKTAREIGALHDGVAIRRAVAQNKNCPVEKLAQLANDYFEDVREAVAGNNNTTTEILDQLAENIDKQSHPAIACNTNTSRSTLIKVFHDGYFHYDIDVRKIIATNLAVCIESFPNQD